MVIGKFHQLMWRDDSVQCPSPDVRGAALALSGAGGRGPPRIASIAFQFRDAVGTHKGQWNAKEVSNGGRITRVT